MISQLLLTLFQGHEASRMTEMPVGQPASLTELCCENGLRYLDLRRWKKAEEVLNQPMYGMNFSGTKLSDDPNDDAAFFKRTQYIKRVYERKFYWYPIYQEQIDKDPTLVQAPFWDK